MVMKYSFTSNHSIEGEQREHRGFYSERDIDLAYDYGDSSSGNRRKENDHRKSWKNNSQLAPIALFVLSNVQLGCEPQDAPIILPAVASFASLGLQHWLFCFWMGFLVYQLCGVALVGSALYYNNLRGSIRTYYLSCRDRSSHYDCYDYKDPR